MTMCRPTWLRSPGLGLDPGLGRRLRLRPDVGRCLRLGLGRCVGPSVGQGLGPFLGLCLCLGLGLGLVRPQSAWAIRGVERYPKVLVYACNVGGMTQAQLDTLAWYDAAVLPEGPGTVQAIRRRNPSIELYFDWMPQNIVSWHENDTSWYPDTTWSLIRLAQLYAIKNDWYLHDIYGARIPEWGGWAANWTRYCPKGTYGTSRGLNYVQWLVQVAIPQIVESGAAWPRWGPGSGGYDGLMLEILVDCVGSFGYQAYENADPDRDGQPEGVDASCTTGGDQDSLSILYREMNDTIFHPKISQLQDEGIPILLNVGNKYLGPSWRTDVTGIKLEGWMSNYDSCPWMTWWDWFYGLENPSHTEMWGPGYKWAETFVGHKHDPTEEGWNHTLLQVYPLSNWPEDECQRVKRWGLGTTLLGGGFFTYTKDGCNPWWQPEYEWDFGTPLADFTEETYVGHSLADTLYVRQFSKGFVEVNPNSYIVNGVAAQDSRFGFWQSVSDLRAVDRSFNQVEVDFTAAPGRPSPVDGYELRYATSPVTAGNWDQATPYSGNPLTAPAGKPVTTTVTGLAPSTTWYFLLRNRVDGRLEPAGSNPASATTEAVPDTIPPAAIQDLAASTLDTTRVAMTWTAPGDDGNQGTASSYLIRMKTGGPIADEATWQAAGPVAGPIPAPAPGGSPEKFTVTALAPGISYGFAVRALDKAGNLGGLSNSPVARTADRPPPPNPTPPDSVPPPPPTPVTQDTLPPTRIMDLACRQAGESWLSLTWTAPADSGKAIPATRYVLGFRAGDAVRTETDWRTCTVVDSGLPVPAKPGTAESYRLDGLAASTQYGVAMRSVDAGGRLSPISFPLVATTTAKENNLPPPEPPDSTSNPPVTRDPPPAPIWDLASTGRGGTWIDLRWTATGADSLTGRASSYDLRFRSHALIQTESDWAQATPCDARLPVPAPSGYVETFRWNGFDSTATGAIAIRAKDAAGQLSGLVPGIWVNPKSQPPPPIPPPVTDLAVTSAGSRSAVVTWRNPAPISGGAPLDLSAVGIARIAIVDSIWSRIGKFPNAPAPDSAGKPVTFKLAPLLPNESYFVAVRLRDQDGQWSPLVQTSFHTNEEDLAPPLAPGSLSVAWSDDHGTVTISWAASADPRVTGYFVYRQGTTPEWTKVQDAAFTDTRCQLARPDPAQFRRVAVSSITADGVESTLSPATAIFEDQWNVEGPFPQPVTDQCRVRVHVPASFASGAVLQVEILRLTGERFATVYQSSPPAGVPLDCVWDRKTTNGHRAPPGFYYLLVDGGGRRTIRTIYLGP